MSKISSPLGSRNIGNSSLKHFSVGEEQSLSADEPRSRLQSPIAAEEAMEIRRKAMEEARIKEQQSSARKISALELIMSIARTSIDVPFGDVVFTLKSPKAREQAVLSKLFAELVSKAKSGESVEEYLYDYRLACLTYSISAVDGVPLEQILKAQDNELLERKQELIQEMDDGLVTYLFAKYEKLTEEHQSKFAEIKGAEELVSSVKKSG